MEPAEDKTELSEINGVKEPQTERSEVEEEKLEVEEEKLEVEEEKLEVEEEERSEAGGSNRAASVS